MILCVTIVVVPAIWHNNNNNDSFVFITLQFQMPNFTLAK